MRVNLSRAIASGALAITAAACSDAGDSTGTNQPAITPRNTSVSPALVKGMPAGVQAFSIFSSGDTLPGMPRFGGSADGAGLLRNPDGTFTMITNHEDNFAVSRVTLDAAFTPVAIDYVMNSASGRWRLCSATMVTPEEHGFGPLFFTTGESGIESQTHGINPRGAAFTTVDDASLVPAFGRWSAENAVPLPKTAYPARTVVIIGDDDSGTNGGQLAMYVGTGVGEAAAKIHRLVCSDPAAYPDDDSRSRKRPHLDAIRRLVRSPRPRARRPRAHQARRPLRPRVACCG